MNVPPLRECREDVPFLTCYFVQEHARRMRRNTENIPTHAMQALTSYNWPGDIWELKNVIERSVVRRNGPELHVALQELNCKSAPVALHGWVLDIGEAGERA